MKRTTRIFALAAAVMTAAAMLASCSDGNEVSQPEGSEVSSALEKPAADTLRREIIGQWGRLGETMHTFYNDGSCIIGGMYGYYEISDDGDLTTTTVEGTKTVYKWDDSESEGSWLLSGDILTVAGYSFTKISDETEDTAM